MILNGVKPNRIRVELLDRLNLSSDTLPSLQCIQNYASYFKRAKLSFADYVEDLQALLVDTEYHPALAVHDPFTFGFSRDEKGLPSIGDGSNAQPFVVGASTQKLLQVMDRPSESFVFHIDATYKLNQVGYRVVVCGVSDGGRSFHLAAIFVISQQTEEIFTIVLEQLARMFEMTTNKSLKRTYVMGDADQAQHNALQAVFPDCTKLMCFYHVAANVDKHSTLLEAEVAWDQTQRLQAFRDYFKRRWVTSAHWRWQ
ncbi:TPA: hypothetical protein N0F65_006229 [Lagenidium giganteum]|uniref:MULE transposase domain-containing protein n=1 Tax=Lagenidium giganteum TaxID=4803 RepID=A0AAV2Z1W1_9STRA|nr:TPA: hypothetical protein N0F65_006229 [Lagenidium giganteum]